MLIWKYMQVFFLNFANFPRLVSFVLLYSGLSLIGLLTLRDSIFNLILSAAIKSNQEEEEEGGRRRAIPSLNKNKVQNLYHF